MIASEERGYGRRVKCDDYPPTPRRRCLAALSVAGVAVRVLCFGGPALAQSDSAEAEALIRQGVALRMKKQDERALPFF
ncbi:MAG TPA: hypothetical protein VN914_06340, partial [Polyangia bacterium]|nr:hypothetical protein [Polyangia bacterium]